MITPELVPDPDHYEHGTVKYHLAAAEWNLKLAASVDDDCEYDPDGTDQGLRQDLHTIKQLGYASAHAAIAQAKVVAGWPVTGDR